MKKTNIFKMSLLLFAALFIGGCCSKSYNLVLLGDVHYDAPEYHDSKALKFDPKVPYGKGTRNKDGIFSWRSHTLWVTESQADTNHNIPLNAKMWEKHLPELLDNAARCARETKALYAFQLGDMIHGDCGRLELHQANLRDAINELDKRFDCPVLPVCGNHDPRGLTGREAWDKTIQPYIAGIVKNYPAKRGNYHIRIGKDLFYVHDVMDPDLDHMEKVFKDNADARYTFFVSHVPLLPPTEGDIMDILSDDYDRLFALLESRNAIVLSGHTHWISVTEYRNKKNNRQINQFIINSTVRSPKTQLAFKKGDVIKKSFDKNIRKNHPKHFALHEKYFKDKVSSTLNTRGSGYAVLRVSDEGVFVDYRNLKQKDIHTFKLR